MRIAHFLLGRVNADSANGVDKTAFFLSVEQARLGHDVAVFSITAKPPLPVPGVEVKTYLRRPLLRGVSFSIASRFPLGLPKRMISEVLDWAPDMVHFHSIHVPEALWLSRALRRFGIRYCVTPNGALAPAALKRGPLKTRLFARLFERRYLSHASFIHAVSQADAEGLAILGVRTRIVFGRNCIDHGAVPGLLDRALIRRRLPQLAGKRILLYLGRLDPNHKGLDLLVEAWSRVHADDMALVLVGPDWRGGQAQLTKLVRQLGATESIVLAPPVSGSEKWSYLAGTDAFVHTSRWEGAPFAVLEAMLLAKPVLLTEAADPEGLIRRAQAGIVVPPHVVRIAAGLEAVARLDAVELDTMGESARRLIMREFRWKTTADRIVRAYEDALGSSRP